MTSLQRLVGALAAAVLVAAPPAAASPPAARPSPIAGARAGTPAPQTSRLAGAGTGTLVSLGLLAALVVVVAVSVAGDDDAPDSN